MNLDDDRKAEMTMLVIMEDLPNPSARLEFAKSIGLPWGEYLYLKKKYRQLLDRYRKDLEK